MQKAIYGEELCRGVVIAIRVMARKSLHIDAPRLLRRGDYNLESALSNTMELVCQLETVLASYPMPMVFARVLDYGEDGDIQVEVLLRWGDYVLSISPCHISFDLDDRDKSILMDCPSPRGIEGDLLREISDCLSCYILAQKH